MKPEKNYTLNDVVQKIINYLYKLDIYNYTDMDYALLQWVTERKN